MPKKTFTMGDFSGGMNKNADENDVLGMKSVTFLANMHVDHLGKISAFDPRDASLQWDDHESNVSGNITEDYDDLDLGIGDPDPSESDALDMAIGAIGSPSSDLSWEDGTYNFRYTVCKDLGNGIIEEGPLQKFEGLTDGQDMSADDKATFTFSVTGDADPNHMDADYATALNICGRVYYARVSGQGSLTQPGYIHLCDLIYTHTTDNDRIQPRAIGGIGDPNTAVITIEEPPTASSFEMNAIYPSDVGILDVKASPFTDCESRVILGIITYIAKSGYIYRSVPGKPDIFPTDNWIDLTKYGTSSPCKAMYGLGNVLCYFTANELIVFDIVNDVILKTMRGYGIDDPGHASKVNEGVVFRAPGDTNLNTRDFFYFDGNKMSNLTKGRTTLDTIWDGTNIMYQEGVDWVSWKHYVLDVAGTDIYYENRGIYSFKSDTVFSTAIYTSDGTNFDNAFTMTIGKWHGGDPARYKRIYKIVLHGNKLDTSTILLTDEIGDFIPATKAYDDHKVVTWTPDSSLKTRMIRIRIIPLSNDVEASLHSFSVVYRDLNKF